MLQIRASSTIAPYTTWLAVLSEAPIVDDTAAGAAWVRPYEMDGEVQPEPEPKLSVAQK